MSEAHDRRQFLKRALELGAALPVLPTIARATAQESPRKPSPSERLNLGVIGVAGRGGENLNSVHTENIVALCDIDLNRLNPAAAAFPQAKAYQDFRRVFDHKDLDAVVISTPDHMHAIPVALALRAGLDVYCEKPLAHSVHEVRVLRKLAADQKRVTQMGTQIHAGDNYRRVVELVQAGTIGPISRVHVWMGGRPSPGKRVAEGKAPANVDYDLWLGPAPYRPFHESHFHFNWRNWFDFGGGTLADFGCHYMDLPYWALDLGAPLTIEAEGKKDYEGDNDTPGLLRVDYHFPPRGARPAVHMTWYHGGWKPEGAEVYEKGSAVLFEGTRGRILADYGSRKVFAGAGEPEPVPPAPTIPASIGHHEEWISAVKSRGATTCNFAYSGELAETVLLGNVAYRTGKKLTWDAAQLRADVPEAAQYVQREYRKGWSL